MIRITQQVSATSAKRCYAAADYYSDGRGRYGSWGGKGASQLGLDGIVDRFAFRRLCDNLHPLTGERVTGRTRAGRTVGYDFKFSVSKSISLLYAVSEDQDILNTLREAVGATMREIEAVMKTRVRKAGQDMYRTTGNMIWAEFIHRTSCPIGGLPDPQLHVYVFVFNMTWDEEEEGWKAGWFGDIKRDAPYFQAAFRVRLAGELQELGFGVDRRRDDFEVTGIPSKVLKRFSRRTALIERLAKERGIIDPEWKAELGPKTRENKWVVCGWDALRKEWNTRLTDQERHVLAAVHRRATPHLRPINGEAVAVDQAIEHCFVHKSVLPERQLVTEALKFGIGSVTVENVIREVGRRPLIRSDEGGYTMVERPR